MAACSELELVFLMLQILLLQSWSEDQRKRAGAKAGFVEQVKTSFLIIMLLLLSFLSDPSPIIGYACQWLTDWLPFSKLDWCDLGVWRCQLKTCWGLLLLLILMMRIVLATVCCILRSWGLVIKPNFCSDFKHKVSSRYWSWSSGKIFKLEFGQYFAADVLQRLWSWILVEMLKLGLVNILNSKFSRGGDVWLRFWSKWLVDILNMKFDQDLCLNLWVTQYVSLAMFFLWNILSGYKL